MPNERLEPIKPTSQRLFACQWQPLKPRWAWLTMACALLCAGCGVKPANNKPKPLEVESPTSKNNNSSQHDLRTTGPSQSDVPVPLFVQVEAVGLQALRYENGEAAGWSSILESLGGGIGVCDYDLDGRVDVVAPSGGSLSTPEKIVGLPTHILRGTGNLGFDDCSRQAHIDAPIAYTHGITIADYDNDGFCDLLVTGYGRLQLFHNLSDGTFVECAIDSGLTDNLWSSSAAWCDVDRDGCLDLYVCHYVNWSFANNPYCAGPDADHREICSPRDFAAVDHVLYLSQGDGHFVDVSASWGLAKGGKGLGVVAGDVDGDGLPDIYVANDTTENFLYRNRGDHFEEVGQAAGVAHDDEGIPNGSMGVDLADFNGDLQPDLWAANYERESFALYRNEGSGIFLHVSRPTGVTALAGLFVGFGTVFLDADGDGDLDVLVSNGHVIKYPQFSKRQQVPLLLENKGNKFTRRSFPTESYFSKLHEGRGLATGDFNGDGHLDVVISHVNASPAMLLSTLGAEHRSLTIRLVGRTSNRSAIGSQVILKHSQGKTLRMLSGGGSYLSSHQPLIVFELPQSHQPQSLEIKWPSGNVQNLEIDPTLASMEIIESP